MRARFLGLLTPGNAAAVAVGIMLMISGNFLFAASDALGKFLVAGMSVYLFTEPGVKGGAFEGHTDGRQLNGADGLGGVEESSGLKYMVANTNRSK